MAAIKLRPNQLDALKRMKNGCVLHSQTGVGKSYTALAYYYINNGGKLDGDNYTYMKNPKDLYIITTSKKRDDREWDIDIGKFLLFTNDANPYDNKIIIDSWQNLKKYVNVKNAFFIFDEQRVTGKGVWASSFIKISKNNEWIMLSATPGDKWEDYIPLFVANGFYKSITEFKRNHIIYSPYVTTYPKIDRYINIGRLIRLRESILVEMVSDKQTVQHDIYVNVGYDVKNYNFVFNKRWNVFENAPVKSASEICYILRKIVNSDKERIEQVKNIVADRGRVIIFYNFDYELEILKNEEYIYDGCAVEIAEWNGHKHQPIPTEGYWVYLVQYTSGCEGWNCTRTDTIIFYSQNYSYKVVTQAKGRIDRINTSYIDLYYYTLISKSPIDLAIKKALLNKKKFNETRYIYGK